MEGSETKKVKCGLYSYAFLQKLCILLDETIAKLKMSEDTGSTDTKKIH